ncbi:hypothetical protein EGW08_014220 [Elysia chlorotica]|uniref:Uncharacterized protein n=1 Tax=Elysia chlorotica TaxID=188477 RepID=A0A3S1B7Q0_ELYCH|nr:hypothetical protein EGW08_014220 [Elysia chlorotica]
MVFAELGCRGDFEVCVGAAQLTTPKSKLTCKKVTVKSTKKRPGQTRVTDSKGEAADLESVTLIRQISSSVPCKEWVNYFVFGSIIITKQGCQACFRVCYKDGVVTTTPAPLNTTPLPENCKRYKVLKPTRKLVRDSNNRPVRVTRVVLVREFSKEVCREGVNYFFRKSLFVAHGGCKGIFKVFYAEVTTPAPLTTTEKPAQIVCKKVDVKSVDLKPKRVDVTDSDGSPVDIVHVHVWDQISELKCVEWVNYFYAESFIVAKGGCQATFKVCYKEKKPETTPAPLTTTTPEPVVTTTEAPQIVCEKVDVKSENGRPGRTDVTDSDGNPVHIVHVHVWDQISKIKCVEWVNYFYAESYIVAKKGCQATFKVCYKVKKPETTPAPLTTTTPEPEICKKYIVLEPTRVTVGESNSQPASISSVVLEREISSHVCQQGLNYFFEGADFVVKEGCKGVFTVCYTVKKTTPAPLTTTTEAPQIVCEKVDVKSENGRPGRTDVTDSDGNPVHIVHVHVWDQISKIKCVEWVNYFYAESYIVAKKGCQATFKVCYKVKKPETTPAPLTTTTKAPVVTEPAPSVVCERVDVKSVGGRPSRVDVVDADGNPVHIVHVHVWDQISKIKCVEWVNYFFFEDFIVAKKGCQATFKVCYKVKKPETTPAPLTTTTSEPEICKEYIVLEPTRVTVGESNSQPASISSVVLEREISSHVCQQGLNYFFEGADFVVKEGCKGVFTVCYTVKKTTPAPLTTTTEAPKIACKQVDVKSDNVLPARAEVTDSNGNPVEIVHVHVWDQISQIKCVEWVNYFYFESFVIAKKGCQATFKVCYKEKKPETTPAPLTTTPAKPKTICKPFVLDGSGPEPDIRTIRESGTDGVTITSIKLVKEFSHRVCREWFTFFAAGNLVSAREGCKGVFHVCFEIN